MDFEDITLGEIAEIEDYAQLPFSDIAEDRIGVIKLRIALAWVMKRRENPKYTIAEAEKLTPGDFAQLFGDDDNTKK
tara:strand:- start:1258 stop:1488 length:231 start_codon:yes stop_codon:yes gene_type:complete